MWRPAHGATNRPGQCRPASGYGRALGRPGPRDHDPYGDDPVTQSFDAAAFGPSAFGAVELEERCAPVSAADQEVEAPAPVTP